MKLLFPYITYKNVINLDMCQRIIDLGLSTINENKNNGISTYGSTLNEKSMQEMSNERNRVSEILTASDYTKDQIKNKGWDLDKVIVRHSEICWLKDKFLYDLILPFIGKANKEAGWNWHIDTAEAFQFTVYHGSKDNGGFYGWHSDGFSDFNFAIRPALKISNEPLRFKPPKKNSDGKFLIDKNNQLLPDMEKEDLPMKKDKTSLTSIFSEDNKKWGKVRKISMTLNLSNPDTYEGGDLKFDLGPHSKKDRIITFDDNRSQGSIIIFPSFTYHCVTPVTSGTRYSLVLWCMGKPWQ